MCGGGKCDGDQETSEAAGMVYAHLFRLGGAFLLPSPWPCSATASGGGLQRFSECRCHRSPERSSHYTNEIGRPPQADAGSPECQRKSGDTTMDRSDTTSRHHGFRVG